LHEKVLYICTRFEVTVISKVGRHINKILKIQSNEQKNISTIEKKKEEITDLWTEWLLQMEEKFLRVEELKEDIS
jgi:S-adenosylmethionine synthetase